MTSPELLPQEQHRQMRDAIDAVELAMNGLEIDSIVRLFEGAADSVMVKLPLGALRQLGGCYPELNRIINDPAFKSLTRAPSTVGEEELKHTDADREYATDLMDDLDIRGEPIHAIITQWFAKARVETALRIRRQSPTSGTEGGKAGNLPAPASRPTLALRDVTEGEVHGWSAGIAPGRPRGALGVHHGGCHAGAG